MVNEVEMELALGTYLDVRGRVETSLPRTVQTLAAKKALCLGALLCFFQMLDGLLTSLGVSRFGTEIEGNPFLRALMEDLGQVTALGIVKLASVLVILGLVAASRKLPWVSSALGALTCVYFFSAILPWTYILFVQPL